MQSSCLSVWGMCWSSLVYLLEKLMRNKWADFQWGDSDVEQKCAILCSHLAPHPSAFLCFLHSSQRRPEGTHICDSWTTMYNCYQWHACSHSWSNDSFRVLRVSSQTETTHPLKSSTVIVEPAIKMDGCTLRHVRWSDKDALNRIFNVGVTLNLNIWQLFWLESTGGCLRATAAFITRVVWVASSALQRIHLFCCNTSAPFFPHNMQKEKEKKRINATLPASSFCEGRFIG